MRALKVREEKAPNMRTKLMLIAVPQDEDLLLRHDRPLHLQVKMLAAVKENPRKYGSVLDTNDDI